jgi:hypothetical protein
MSFTALEDTNLTIGCAEQAAQRRRKLLLARRRPVLLLDHWLDQVELLVERDDSIVPEPLISEIAGFLEKFNPHLYRRLRRTGRREASRVLDLLFEAEERFLPKVADTA